MKIDDFLADLDKRYICIDLLVNNRSLEAVDYIIYWGECDRRTAIDAIRSLKESDEYRQKLDERKAKKERDKQRKIQDLKSRSLIGNPDTTKPEIKSITKNNPDSGKARIKDTKKQSENVSRKTKKRYLYLVDGDNHVYEAIEGIVRKTDDNDRIKVFVSQLPLCNKLIEKKLPNTEIFYVEAHKKGDQAVDNRIKSELGNAVKSRQYRELFVISRDKGYRNKLEEYRGKYGYTEENLDLRDIF